MKLYKVTNAIDDWMVLAEDPNDAQDKLIRYLRDLDYGFESSRKVTKIEVLAEEVEHPSYGDKNKILIR